MDQDWNENLICKSISYTIFNTSLRFGVVFKWRHDLLRGGSIILWLHNLSLNDWYRDSWRGREGGDEFVEVPQLLLQL